MSVDVAALHAAHWAALVRFARRRVPDTQTAEDIAAEAFAKAWRAAPTYQDRGHPPSAWLYKIAHHLIADHYRLLQRRGAPVQMDGREPHWDADPIAAADIEAALTSLTPEQAETVRLRYLDGLPISETARRTGRTDEAVKKLAARGLRRLRVALHPGMWTHAAY